MYAIFTDNFQLTDFIYETKEEAEKDLKMLQEDEERFIHKYNIFIKEEK